MGRLLGVPAVTSVVVALAVGCSSSPSAPQSSTSPAVSTASTASPAQADRPLPDPAVLLNEASTTTKHLKGVHLALSVIGKIAAMPVRTLDGDLTNQPGAAAKGTAMITIMGSQAGIGFVVTGGHLYATLPGGRWRDYGPAAEAYDVTTILNPDTGLANVLANFIDPKVEAREIVGGQQTIRVAGRVAATAVNRVVPQLDTDRRISSTVWIQERGDHQVVQAKLEPGRNGSVQMALSNWNAPVTVAKPAGV